MGRQKRLKDLTSEQNEIFQWHNGYNGEKLIERYRQHFGDKQFRFPRQKVSKVKLFKNIPLCGVLTGKTLKAKYTDSFINFCNDTTNFNWSETTWAHEESDYYIRLYNNKNKVIGKLFFCLDNCSMTSSRPFCPSMKFGGLSEEGLSKIKQLINDKEKWE